MLLCISYYKQCKNMLTLGDRLGCCSTQRFLRVSGTGHTCNPPLARCCWSWCIWRFLTVFLKHSFDLHFFMFLWELQFIFKRMYIKNDFYRKERKHRTWYSYKGKLAKKVHDSKIYMYSLIICLVLCNPNLKYTIKYLLPIS